MRASDGSLRLSAPILPMRRDERRSVAPPRRARSSWLTRWFGRREKQPSTYHRCLAIHIHFAGPHSALH